MQPRENGAVHSACCGGILEYEDGACLSSVKLALAVRLHGCPIIPHFAR